MITSSHLVKLIIHETNPFSELENIVYFVNLNLFKQLIPYKLESPLTKKKMCFILYWK